ncbi:hypothetical protein MPHO_53260 [Mycolicibacterium phocaicum]|nr:hypothetical protein MPHO_53260 [Mycolicibacterium phocaicum]
MSAALAPWRAPRSTHDPAKVLIDLATAVALGGDCAADIAVARAQPQVFGHVASDATVSRLITTLGGDVDAVIAAIGTARAAARARVWARRRPVGGAVGDQVIIDLDATLVTAHSDKQGPPDVQVRVWISPDARVRRSRRRRIWRSPRRAAAPGCAGSNSAADHITVLDAALAQLPEHERPNVVVRTDTGGGVKDFLHHITALGLQYSIGFYGMPRSWKPSRRCHGRHGAQPSMAMAHRARAPRSPS